MGYSSALADTGSGAPWGTARTYILGVWVIPVEGVDARHLATPGSLPDWSPDGRFISFPLRVPAASRQMGES